MQTGQSLRNSFMLEVMNKLLFVLFLIFLRTNNLGFLVFLASYAH